MCPPRRGGRIGPTRIANPPSPTSAPQLPEEAILILEPGPGSRLTSPIHVRGMADSTFEQHLVVTDSISGGVAHVEGYALASFEQPLVVEVRTKPGRLPARRRSS